MDAVLVDFVGEMLALGDFETQVSKKSGRAGEEADAGDGMASRFLHQGIHKQAADAESFGLWSDGDGADFGEVRAVQVKGAAADDAGVFFGDDEIADVFRQL